MAIEDDYSGNLLAAGTDQPVVAIAGFEGRDAELTAAIADVIERHGCTAHEALVILMDSHGQGELDNGLWADVGTALSHVPRNSWDDPLSDDSDIDTDFGDGGPLARESR